MTAERLQIVLDERLKQLAERNALILADGAHEFAQSDSFHLQVDLAFRNPGDVKEIVEIAPSARVTASPRLLPLTRTG